MHHDSTVPPASSIDQSTDTLIVGGGPIGIELAVGLKQAGVPATIVEAGPIGATIGWWAPSTTFFSSPERIAIAGVPLVSPDQGKATRERYLTYLRGVVAQFDLDVRTFRRVTDLARERDGRFVATVVPSAHGVGGPDELERVRADRRPDGDAPSERWRAERLVLAIGDMHRPRLLGVPGEFLPHVSHHFDDPHRGFRRRVVVVGGKNSAVEAALRLHRVGAEVTIVHRGEAFDQKRVKYWLRPELEWLIAQGQIRFLPRTTVVGIDRRTVTVVPVDGGERATIDADLVYLLTGYEQDPSLFERLGVELVGEQRAPRHDPESMQTDVPGVFVAGTATAGTQRRATVYIENSHIHVARIVRAVTGHRLDWISDPEAAGYARLEES